MNLFEKKVKNDKQITQLNKLIKIGFILLIFLVIIQSFIIIYLINLNQQEQVVGITEEGIPLELEKLNKPSHNLVNLEKFLSYFVSVKYNWDKDTYEENIEEVAKLMSRELEEEYYQEIREGGYIEQVKDYEITSSFTIQDIRKDEMEEHKNGYQIEVIGFDLEIIDFQVRKNPMKLTVGFRPTELTEENIWGLEVFEIKESYI